MKDMIIDNKKIQNYNLGLGLLRLWMSFEVVLDHYWSGMINNKNGILNVFSKFGTLAVPIFVIISFALTETKISKIDKNGFVKRILRLLIPYVLWGIIYWVIYTFLNIVTEKDYTNGISDLIWQLSFGSSENLNPPLWYMFDLIVLTILFSILFKIVKNTKYSNYIVYGIIIISIILQYSEINYKLFCNMRYEMKWPLGRIIEMIPYAGIGIIISRKNILNKLKNDCIKVILIVSPLILILLKFEIFTNFNGFGYHGIYRIILASLVIIIFYVIPFEKMYKSICNSIVSISRYAMEVFCMHYIVGKILNYIYLKVQLDINTFSECIIIYIICLIISLLISKIPIKFCEKLVT